MILILIIGFWLLITGSLFVLSGYYFLKSKYLSKKHDTEQYNLFLNRFEHDFKEILEPKDKNQTKYTL